VSRHFFPQIARLAGGPWLRCGASLFALVAPLAPTDAAGQSIDISRLVFQYDETLMVPYQFSANFRDKSIFVYSASSSSGKKMGLSGDADWRPENLAGTLEVKLSDYVSSNPNAQDTLTPVVIELRDGDAEGYGPVVVSKHIYVENPVQPQTGTMILPAGPFYPGQEIEVRVDRASGSEGVPPSNWSLAIYRSAVELDDGTILLPRAQSGYWISQASQTGGSSLMLPLPSSSGRYEIQLRDESNFILDRAPIEVLPVIPEATLLLDGGEEPIAGGASTVAALGANHLPVSLYVIEPGVRGGWSPSYESDYLEPRSFEVDARPKTTSLRGSILMQTPYSGARRLAAVWPAMHDFGGVLLGTLDYLIMPSNDGATASNIGFGTALQGAYLTGEPIDIVADDVPWADRIEELRIYAAPGEDPNFSGRLPDDAVPLISVPMTALPFRATINEPIPPGEYVIASWRRAYDREGLEAWKEASLTVLPERSEFSVSVNPGSAVYAYQPYTVDLKLRKPAMLSDPRFSVQLVHLGGTLNDCRYVLEHAAFFRRLGPGTEASIVVENWGVPDEITYAIDRPLIAPGAYEARLYFGPVYETEANFGQGSAILLASTPFSVSYQSLPGALGLETVETTERQPIKLTLRLPPGLQKSTEVANLGIQLVRQSEEAASGVERLSATDEIMSLRPADDPDGSIVPIAPNLAEQAFSISPQGGRFRMGRYELRLVQDGFCFLGDCRKVLLDRIALTIRDEVWRGPEAVAFAPSDLAAERVRPGFARMDVPNACGDDNEEMVLSFARLVDGEPGPVEGPIDFGRPFFVEGRLSQPPKRQVYHVTLETPSGLYRTVALYPVDGDPMLVRSVLTYLMWDIGSAAADGATP
jgi:hypothetical protein